ncbi:hypothetical protein GCM10009718_30600 [Isoptericola halotolerans]|uniref:Lipoprotein n=1 Tax=Isoptericola halotolerans TaxID=300560 RepID=A0ABX2A4V7_9MICO|nr:hypothetical protein [Isoptericola halotolerans]NOV97601.1 hypothetical protein [Isoptericola halotolerans]
MTTARRLVAAAVTLTVAGALAACGTDEPALTSLAEQQASASPSPSLTEEESTKQERIAEAEAVLAEYRGLEFEVAQGGYGNWALLAPYWGAELADSVAGTYREFSERGLYTTGEAELVSSEVTAYDGERVGYEDVEVTACLNTSGLRIFEEDGTELDLPNDTLEQYVNVYRLSHTGPDGRWQVLESTARTDREC